MSNAITRAPQQAVLRPQSFAELQAFAAIAARSNMVPQAYRTKPDDIMLAVQMGSEVGLAPMQAIQNIAVINGRPSVWGDAALALCKSHPDFVSCEESVTGKDDARVGRCVMVRRGEPPIDRTFSVSDAKKAGLWGKTGPWTAYPDRMLQLRARGFAARDAFPDALRGLITAEEARDVSSTPDTFTGQTIDAVVEELPQEPTPPKRTASQFLSELAADLERAETADAVDAILSRDDVQKAQDIFTNGARDKLTHLINSAIRRTTPEPGGDEDGWDRA